MYKYLAKIIEFNKRNIKKIIEEILENINLRYFLGLIF